MLDPTPGQICYEAWVCVDGHPRLRRWDELVPMERRRWEAAANAVLAWQAQEDAP